MACTGGTPPSLGAAARSEPSAPRGETLVVSTHTAIGPVAASQGHLVWESVPLESAASVPTLRDRNLTTGKTRTLAAGVDPLFGVAATSRFVFYARSSGRSTSLIRVSHEGTGTRVLTGSLATPIASRDGVVAWGETSGGTERVVASNGSRHWLVATMARCTPEACYRLDTVTVAAGGVIFTRDAIGVPTSQVVRRSFGSHTAAVLDVRGDPQPNLVPSSSGALYYVLSRGWYRWDFGAARPRTVRFANHPVKELVLHERRRWFWLVRHGCTVRLESTDAGDGTALAPPRRVVRLGAEYGPTCQQLGDLVWAGGRVIASWAIASEAAESAHTDVGLRGVVVATR